MTLLSSLQDCAATIEALIFASDRPIREHEIKLYLPEGITIDNVIAAVAARYNENSGIELCRIGDAYAFRTKAEVGERLSQHKKVERRLSRAAMEVLAIVAYHQPITRTEIEEIRGISLSKGIMDILLELGWIKPCGRRRTPGRPLTWGTSLAFLDHFGLAAVTDLPGIDDLKSAGLLRKGQILGAFVDTETRNDGSSDEEEDFFEDGFLDPALDGDEDASV